MAEAKAAIAFAVAVAIVLFCGTARAAIVVFDRVALIGRPVQLMVLTRGRLFPEGGQLVTLSVGHIRLKKRLTGGDGYGYWMYYPSEAGLIELDAEYENGRESGTLLVMNPQEQAILVDVDTAARESLLSVKLRQGTHTALETLSKHYRIIYLQGMTGLSLTRRWLETSDLPASVVLSWRNVDRLELLERDGIQLHAIIGSADQITAAEDHVRNRFSFEKTKSGRQVDSWEDVLEALETQPPSNAE